MTEKRADYFLLELKFYKKLNEMEKKKALEWAKKHGCYEEVKKYYEMK